MGVFLCYLASAIRQVEIAAEVKDFGNKPEKGAQAGSWKELTSFADLREIKGFTQRAHKRFIMTDRFTGAVGKFSHRLSVTFHEFNHDIERFYLRDIAGQAGTDAEA